MLIFQGVAVYKAHISKDKDGIHVIMSLFELRFSKLSMMLSDVYPHYSLICPMTHPNI